MDDEIRELKKELAKLRKQIDEVDDWANGIQNVLVSVLPFLLRGHPEVEKVQGILKSAADRYEELGCYPMRAQAGEPQGLYEAPKMVYRHLALLGVWPGVEPRQFVEESMKRYGR